MSIDEQYQIVKNLLTGVEELNGEFQEGWEQEIADGESLLEYFVKLMHRN